MLLSEKKTMIDFITLGRAVIENEARSISNLLPRINADFEKACHVLLSCQGRIVVLGMGKSGHIGSKIAATLASTGSPSFFVHPGEASHGDLGMITRGDVVLMLSNSGETAELLTLLPVIKRLGVSLISMTGNAQSTLAKNALVNLDVSVEKEACPLGLAPTSSTTATLAMGDALAVALLNVRGFTSDDFALSHPGGALGRRLLLRTQDLMHQGEAIPKVSYDTPLSVALLEITQKKMGMTAIVDEEDKLLGIFTDGDLRRAIDNNVDIHKAKIGELMTKGSKTIAQDSLAYEALKMMEDHKVLNLLITDAQSRLIGALSMHDLLKAKVV